MKYHVHVTAGMHFEPHPARPCIHSDLTSATICANRFNALIGRPIFSIITETFKTVKAAREYLARFGVDGVRCY